MFGLSTGGASAPAPRGSGLLLVAVLALAFALATPGVARRVRLLAPVLTGRSVLLLERPG